MDEHLPDQNQAGNTESQPNTPPQAGRFVYPNGGKSPEVNLAPGASSGTPQKDATDIFAEKTGNTAKSGYNPLSQFSQSITFDRQGQAEAQQIVEPDASHVGKRPSRVKTALLAMATIAGVVALVGGITYLLLKSSAPKPANNVSTNQYQVGSVSLSDLAKSNTITIDQGKQLDVNGQLRVNNSLVLAASDLPANPQLGQLVLTKDGTLQYYDGTKFIPVATSIGGQAGTIAVGQGLSIAGNTISNTGVVTIQGQSGAVTLTAGQGIAINGTTITNTGIGLSSVSGQNGVIATTSGSNVTLSLPTAASNGLCLVSTSSGPQFGSCTGQTDVTSLNGASGALSVADATESGGTITINDASTSGKGLVQIAGSTLVITGGTLNTQQQLNSTASPTFASLNLTSALTVANGGLGATTFTDHGILVGHNASAVTALGTGNNGDCLISQGSSSDPLFSSCPVGGNVSTGTGHTGGTIAMFDPSNNQHIIDSVLTQSSGNIFVGGSLEVKSSSTTAFQIQKSDGTGNLFIGDTSNGLVGIGKAPNASLLDVPLQVGGAAQFFATSAPTADAAHNGTIYFNNADGKFHIIEDGVEKTLCNTVNQSCGAGTADIKLQTAYTGGNTITTADARDILFTLSDTATDANFITDIQGTSTGKFAVEKAGTDILSVVANPSPLVTITGALTVSAGITGDGTNISNVNAVQLGGIASSGYAKSGANSDITSTTALNTITPSSTLQIGSTGQTLTLQGSGSTTILAQASPTSKTTLSFTNALSKAVGYYFDNTSSLVQDAQNYYICTSAGNCAGVGGSVTSSGTGNTGFIPVYGSDTGILKSRLKDTGTGDALVLANLTVGAASSDGQLSLTGAGGQLTTIKSGNPGTGYTLTLPSAVSAGCLQSDGSGNLTFATCLTGGGAGSGITSIVGTSNQISVAGGTGPTATISLPTTITGTAGSDFTLAAPSAKNLVLQGTSITVNNNLTPATAAGASLGTALLPFSNIFLGTAASKAVSFDTSALTANRTLSVADVGGTICTSVSSTCSSTYQIAGSYQAAGSYVNLQGSTPGSQQSGSINVSGTIIGGTAVTTPLLQSSSGVALAITPGAALTIGATGQSFTLQGTSASVIKGYNGANATTLAFGTVTGNATVTIPNATGTVAVSATTPISLDTAGNITLGTVPLSKGGTGLTTTTPANGQLLIGNGTGYTLSTLTAGSGNITITNASGSITIDAPNSGSCSSCANTTLSNLTSSISIPGAAGDIKTASGSNSLGGGLETNSFANAYLTSSLRLGINTSGANYFQLSGTSAATGARTINLDNLSGRVILAQQTTTPTAQNGTVSVDNTQTSGSALTLANSGSTNTAATISASSSNTTSGNTASFSGSQTTGTIETVTGNSLTTGTALQVTANALTTGSALSVGNTSVNSTLTSGNIASISLAPTIISTLTQSGNVLNASRSNTVGGALTQDGATVMGENSSLSITVTDHGDNKRLLLAGSNCGKTLSFNGSTFTQLAGTGGSLCLYYLTNPSVGTFSVTGLQASLYENFVSSWYNVDQTTPVSNGTSTATNSITITSSVGDVALDYDFYGGGSSVGTPGAGQTSVTATDSASRGWGQSSKAGAASSTTLTWTNGQIHIGAALHPATGIATITGAVASLSSNCIASAGTCTDSGNVLNLNQQYASASGAVLKIQNSGTGADILIGSSTTGQIQTAAGTTTTGINMQSGNASAGASGVLTLKTGTGTSSTGSISIQSGNASAGTAGNINIDVGTSTSGGGNINIGTINAAGAINIGQSGSSTNVATSVYGTVLVKTPVTNSTTAFQIQSSSSTLLAADTSAMRVSVGSVGTATSQLFVGGSLPSSALGQVTPGSGGGTTYGIAVQGKYAYLTPGIGVTSLQTFDISNPASPALLNTATTISSNIKRVVVQGKYAYVAGGGTFQVFDISNPKSPSSVGSQTYTASTNGVGLYVSGRYALVGDTSTATLYIFDVSNPVNIPAATTLSIASSGTGAAGIYVQGRYAYLANQSSNAFQIIDLSNPASPSIVSTLTTAAGGFSGTLLSVYVQGKYAYVGTTSNVYVIDVSNPASPSTSTNVVARGDAVYAQGRFLYAASSAGSIRAIDISTPSSATLVTGTITAQSPLGMTVQGRYMYTSNNGATNQLQVFDLGGEYSQQLEAGGLDSETLSVRENALVGNDLQVQGGLTVGNNTQLNGQLAASGDVLFKNTSSTAFRVQNSSGSSLITADTSASNVALSSSATTTTAVTVSANSLTTGTGLSVSTSSANFTSGSLASLSQTSNYSTTSSLSTSANMLNVARSITATNSNAAIAFDNKNSGSTNGVSATASISFSNTSHTTGAVVITAYENAGTSCVLSGPNTPVASADDAIFGVMKAWVIGTGSSNSYSTTISSTCSSTIYWVASSYLNVDQTTPGVSAATLGGTNGSGQTSGVLSWSITPSPTSLNQLVVDGYSFNGAATANPSAAGQTAFYNSSTGNQAASYRSATAGSTTMGWTTSATNRPIEVAAVLNPLTATVNVSGAVATLSNQCTISGATCADTSNVLNLNQQYASASGSVLKIQNSGTGADIQLGSGIIRPTTDSTSAITFQNASGSATALTIDTSNQRLAVGASSVAANGVLTIGTNTTTGSGGIYFGTDTNLYRISSNYLRTDSNFQIQGATLSILNQTGQITFGTGSDTNLYRSTTSTLKTDSNFIAAGSGNGTTTYGVLFKNASNSATAFAIQDSTANAVFTLSTNNYSGGANAANATIKVAQDSGTNRSINAAGSINASGADYAEWIPWTGTKPEAGSIVSYGGSVYVVSSQKTAAFVGNDKFSDDAILVTFAGQVPVRVTGDVAAGDILVDNGDGTARAIHPGSATVAELLSKLAIAQESASGAGVHSVSASIGTTSNSIANALQQSPSSYADLSVSGTLTVSLVKVTGDIVVNGHIVTGGATPSAVVQAAAGSGASAVVSGNDTAGTITITTGAGPVAGELIKVAFDKAFAQAPRVIMSPSNDAAGSLRFYKGATTGTYFIFNAKDAPQANTEYKFDYFVVQ